MKKIDPEKSIVLVTHEISQTGAPILLCKIAKSIKKRGYYVVVLSLRSKPITKEYRECCDEIYIVDKIDNYSGKVMRYTGHDPSPRQKRALEAMAVKLEKRGFKYMLINSIASGMCVPVFKKHGFRLVSLVHEMKGACTFFNAEKLIKDMAKLSDVIVFPAEPARRDFESFCGKIEARTEISPQGFYCSYPERTDREKARKALCKKLGVPKDTVFMAGVGIVHFLKGTDIFPLLAKATEDIKNLHFIWLGSVVNEEFNAYMTAMAERLNVKDRIHFTGFIKNEAAYKRTLCACRAFLLTSREDTFPSVLIEAAACRVPIISFAGSGGAESFLADDRGYLVPYMDIDAFSEKVRELASETKTDAVTDKAFEYVKEEFDFEKYTDKLLSYLFEKKGE
ncbi:MAG: glycosyltransferase [Lachnospiraceae bacterium]|nr:glycosyltransferase [Lachnospiraceae bacterium]